MAKYLSVQDESVLEEAHDLFSRLYEKTPYIKRNGMTSLIQILAEKEPRVLGVKLDSIIEDRFVRELETSGFIAKLYR